MCPPVFPSRLFLSRASLREFSLVFPLLAHHCASSLSSFPSRTSLCELFHSFILSYLSPPLGAGVPPSPSCRLLNSRCRRMPTWRRSRRSLLLSFRCAIFALASADKSSPRPLRAQLCLLIRDLIPSRLIFQKNLPIFAYIKILPYLCSCKG